MKIAFYTPSLAVGGYEKVVVNYANAFSKKYEVVILCGMAEGELKNSVLPTVTVVNFNVRARGVCGALTKWLKHNHTDILYVPFASFTAIAVLAKIASHSKTVIYSAQHGFEKKSVYDRLLGKIVQKADVLIAVSKTVAAYDAQRFGIPFKRYYIFDNPVINQSVLQKYDKKSKETLPTFVTAGRLALDKHLEIAIQIVATVSKKQSIRLRILGEGPEKENLKALVKQLGAEEYIQFVGFVNDPIEHMRGCSALLLTSEVESFGNVVVEALCCGVPVITTNCGGPVDIIEGDKYGIAIGTYDDPNVIDNGVRAILAILNGDKRFVNLKQKAERYDAANLENQFLEPYYEHIQKN